MKKFKLILSIALTFLLIFGIVAPMKYVKANPAGFTDEECPTAIEGLTYTGEDQPLVNPPAQMHEGYTDIIYSLGTATSPDDSGWQMGVPEQYAVGTYYVWWSATNETDGTEPCVITVTIAENPNPPETVDEDVEAVIKLIDEIGVVEYTDDCYVKIDTAKNAYNCLTYEQQQMVSNESVLTAALEEYSRLADEARGSEGGQSEGGESEGGESEGGESEGGDDYDDDDDDWDYPIIDEILQKQELGEALNVVQVVHIEGSYALTYDVLDELQYDNMVKVEYALIFDGNVYNIVIPGGYELVEENVFWYGPAYLISHFGTGAVLKKFNDSVDGTYIVQKGDTLTSIAEMFGTTVNELVRLNGLKNPNMISVGQEIIY